MSIKLICIDMDGTLLSKDHSVSEANKKALQTALDKGIRIAITTGRLFTSARYYSNIIGLKAPIISSNGAYIRSKDSSDVIYENPLSLDESKEIYEILKKYNFIYNFNTSDSVITTDDDFNNAYKAMNEQVEDADKIKFVVEEDLNPVLEKYEGDVLKVIVIDKNGSLSDEVRKAKEEFKALGKYEVVSSWSNNFEVMKKGTSKGNAVKHLAEILKIKREEVMCIGDSENDLSMIEYAGVSVAMGNALNILKDKATFITDTNSNDGVAKAILKYLDYN